MPKNVLIVGMARSGTSMTARIFTEQGYFVAEDRQAQLREADSYNPSGYWEAQPLIDANVDLFKAVGFEYDNTWMFEPIEPAQAEAIAKVPVMEQHRQLVRCYEKQRPWIWKDPRLCYTLGYWWPLLDQKNTVVILLTRPHEEIYQSFVRLKWRGVSLQQRKECFQRISEHIQQARKTLQQLDIPFIEIAYNSDFEKTPEQTVKKLNAFCELELVTRDLGYKPFLNHRGLKGKLIIIVDRIAEKIPASLRKGLKSLLPRKLRKLFSTEQ